MLRKSYHSVQLRTRAVAMPIRSWPNEPVNAGKIEERLMKSLESDLALYEAEPMTTPEFEITPNEEDPQALIVKIQVLVHESNLCWPGSPHIPRLLGLKKS